MIALDSVNAARSSAVLISGLPATLPRTPSKMLGTSRPYAEGCDCTFVEAAIALITIIPTTNTMPARRPVVIDQLPFVRCKRPAKFPSFVSRMRRHRGECRVSLNDADVEAVRLRQFYPVRGADRATGNPGARRAMHGPSRNCRRQKSKQRERIGLRARSFGCIEKV